MNKPVKVFIVEGEQREPMFVSKMSSTFFKGKYETKIITLPAKNNLYMLYNMLSEDNFETDILELLRDHVEGADAVLSDIDRQKVDEIFMFFDYEVQQNNLTDEMNPEDVLLGMLSFFDNETENGKLYISYPMVEALYDYNDGLCEPRTRCYYPVTDISEYKNKAGNPCRLRYEEWKSILSIFPLRIKCLMELETLDYMTYKRTITPDTIFHKQNELKNDKGEVFILSAIPEFLYDYFKIDFWRTYNKRFHFKFYSCQNKTITFRNMQTICND